MNRRDRDHKSSPRDIRVRYRALGGRYIGGTAIAGEKEDRRLGTMSKNQRRVWTV